MTNRADLIELLHARRSVSDLVEPGPTRAQIDQMLRAAATVPDHGELRPYRFAVIEGDGRAAFGDALASGAVERKPDMSDSKRDGVRAKAFRSPTIIAIIASPKPGKVEAWEQRATAACAGYAITLAAYSLGVGAVWKSVPFTRGAALVKLFALGESEEVLGWIHLGTPDDDDEDARAPLDLAQTALLVDGGGVRAYPSS